MSVSSCGRGWAPSSAGPQHLTLHNTDSRPGELQLVGVGSGKVFADVDPIGPGTSTTLDVRLGAGRYQVRCLMEDEAAVSGSTVVLTGRTTNPAPGVRPVTQADLVGPTQAYERYVRGRLTPLAQDVAALSRAVASGHTAAARAAWLRAHLLYERLGGAYEAFGELDGDINGLPEGGRTRTGDPHWTGFHRVELGLWHGERKASLLRAVSRLRSDVDRLRRTFADAQIDPKTLAIRAHEISENALQFALTGKDDFGSHSGLATVGANLAGTQAVLRLVRPLLRSRMADLPGLERALHSARVTVAAAEPSGHRDLTRSRRERINAQLSDLCERLAAVASILEPRRIS